MPETNPRRVFVAGGTGFLGYRVVRALLDEGAEVTVLVRPDAEEKLGALRGQVRWIHGDAWNPASLRGRSRGHAVVLHLIGGVKPDPARGLTFRHLNTLSAHNVTQMAVNDGVPHLILLSASAAPIGVSGEYIESKREAERHLQKSGLAWTIIRAPLLYVPGGERNPLYQVFTALSLIPLLGLPFTARAPLAVDTAARGIASLAMSADSFQTRLIGPRQLRRFGRASERKRIPEPISFVPEIGDQDIDEPPFGWLPPR
jgi:uncharacterized protein YbjT (DUF2867 family)